MTRRHLEQAPEPGGDWEEDLLLGGEDEVDAGDRVLFHAAAVRLEPGRLVEHDSGDVTYERGAWVMCETPRGVMQGEVAVASRRTLLSAPLPRILRRATESDRASIAELREREQKVWRAASEAAREIQLPVKVVRAEATQGGGKIVVLFASDSKVIFREWLRGIGQRTRERIELRQIGMRDAARVIGGVGPCGLQLCCNTFLSDFTPVGMKMAKLQGLASNPQKVSGLCGRLLCCLVYEEAHYRAGRQLLPEPGEEVLTPEGRGRVHDVDVLQMLVKVELASVGRRTGPEVATFPADAVERLRR